LLGIEPLGLALSLRLTGAKELDLAPFGDLKSIKVSRNVHAGEDRLRLLPNLSLRVSAREVGQDQGAYARIARQDRSLVCREVPEMPGQIAVLLGIRSLNHKRIRVACRRV
jgi:hypothetical protein